MNVLGIVAEYDPFHNGHLRHLKEAVSRVSPAWTCVVLSPCVKQRGSFSLLSPSDRAFCALEAGADAVFALPVLWTIRDAEHYALGAVSMLSGLGVTHIAFGAETDNLPLLRETADLLEESPSAYRSALKERLGSGVGWPAAVSSAAAAVLPEAAGLLDQPNNILAVSYLRAVRKLGVQVTPVVIRRTGSYRAPGINPESPSASALREALLRGSYELPFGAVPGFTSGLLRRRFLEGRIPDERILDSLLVSRLRAMTAAEYRLLPGLSEGMENALRDAAAFCRSRKELLSLLTGKRYPSSRISRLLTCALLGVTRDILGREPLPDRALLLGLRRNAEMTAFWRGLPVHVVSSFSDWADKAHPAELSAWRVWAQCCRLPDTLPFTEKIISL